MTARILCATDLTGRSEWALRRAMVLANQTGARLTLVHAVDARQSPRVIRAQANRAYVRLLAKVDRACGAASAAVDIAVRAGSPLDVIAGVAKESDADLLVLAAPRPRRFDSLVGTTAERLLRAIGRPVLVVHRDVQGSYRRVAIALDLSNGSLPMIQAAGRLGVLEHAQATLLHATNAPHESMLKTVGVDARSIESFRQGWLDDARLRLQSILTAADLNVQRAQVVVRSDPPATAIRQIIEQEEAQLLAIGASRWLLIKRLLIGSITDSVLRTAMCDVLVIPHRPKMRRSITRTRRIATASMRATAS